MLRFRPFIADERGVAAVEMAMIAPFLALFAVTSINVWDAAQRKEDLRGALKVAAQYYLKGKSNDTEAAAVAANAWNHKPNGATVVITRQYRCGSGTDTVANDSTLCADGSAPEIWVKITGDATSSSAVFNAHQTTSHYVRIR